VVLPQEWNAWYAQQSFHRERKLHRERFLWKFFHVQEMQQTGRDSATKQVCFIYLFIIYFITTMCFNIHENICDPENYASFNRSQSAWMSLYNERGRGRFRR